MKKARKVLALVIVLIMVLSSFTLSVSALADYELKLGEAEYVLIEDGEVITYEFTPAEDGWYAFYSESEEGNVPWADLYDSDGEWLDYDDDFYSDITYWDFLIVAELSAGETYFLEVGAYNDTCETYISVIKNTVVPVSAEIVTYPEDTDAIEGLEYYTVDYTDIEILYTFSDGSTVLWNYFDNSVNGFPVIIDSGFSKDSTTFSYYFKCGDTVVCVEYDIVENPVERIEYIGDPIICYYETGGCFDVDYDDNEYYHYDWSSPYNSDVNVYLKDGTVIDDSTATYLYGDHLSFNDDQWENHWELGENYVIVSFMDCEAHVPVYVEETLVESIEVTELPSVQEYESYYYPLWEGTEVTLTLKTGEELVKVIEEDEIFCDAYYPEFYFDMYGYEVTINYNYDEDMEQECYIFSCQGREYVVNNLIFTDARDVEELNVITMTETVEDAVVEVVYADGEKETFEFDVVDCYRDKFYAEVTGGYVYYQIGMTRTEHGYAYYECFPIYFEDGSFWDCELRFLGGQAFAVVDLDFDSDGNMTLGEAEYVLIEEGEVITYEFTPTEDGWYTFYSEAAAGSDPCATLYDSYGDWVDSSDDYSDDEENDDFRIVAELQAGKTYYLEVDAYYSESDVCETYIVAEKIAAPVSATVVTYPENTEVIEGYEYETVDLNGIEILYEFEDESTYLWSYDDYTDVNGFYIDWYMWFSDDFTKYYVDFECADTVVILEYDVVDAFELDGEAEHVMFEEDAVLFYKFTPAEDGWYTFFSISEGENDPYAILCDSYGDWVDSSDDYSEESDNYDFRIVAYLQGGKTYYLEVGTYNTDYCETYIGVDKTNVPVYAEVVTYPENTEVIEDIEYETADMNGIEILYHFEDGTTYLWSYDDYTDVNGLEVYWDGVYSEDGKEFYIDFECADTVARVKYDVVENPIESIEVTELPSVQEYEFYYHPLWEGTEVTLTLKTGEELVKVIEEDDIFCDIYYHVFYFDMYGYEVTINYNYDADMEQECYIFSCLGREYVVNDLIFTDARFIEELNIIKMTETGVGAVVEGVYAGGGKETFEFDVVDYCWDYYIDEATEEYVDYISGMTLTEHGYAYYELYPVHDEDGCFLGYAFYFLGGYTFIDAEDIEYMPEDDLLLMGDADEDGVVNIKDATAIQKAVAGIITLGEWGEMQADVDGNGTVNVKDATAIQKQIAGIEI